MRTLFFVLALSFSLFGCKKLNKLTQFEMEYTETVVIPASTGINLPFNVLTPDIQSNSEADFEIHDTRKDLIEEIKLTAMQLKITSPTSGNFNFLKNIKIFIFAAGLGETQIAFKDSVPANINSLPLDITGADIQEYIKADKFSLRLNTETKELLASDYQIEVHSVFFVDAKLLKNKK
mgnify:CR=1 FL=1